MAALALHRRRRPLGCPQAHHQQPLVARCSALVCTGWGPGKQPARGPAQALDVRRRLPALWQGQGQGQGQGGMPTKPCTVASAGACARLLRPPNSPPAGLMPHAGSRLCPAPTMLLAPPWMPPPLPPPRAPPSPPVPSQPPVHRTPQPTRPAPLPARLGLPAPLRARATRWSGRTPPMRSPGPERWMARR